MPVHDWTRVETAVFHAFHYSWISHLSEALNQGVLPREFYALPDQEAGPWGPDVLTLRASYGSSAKAVPEGATALAEVPPKVRFKGKLAPSRPRRRLRSVVIRHATDHGVVAVIEVVSPGNKSSKEALRKFLDKATTLLDREIHLLVIDLLPPGKRDPDRIHGAILAACGQKPPQLPADQPITLASYAASPTYEAFVETVAVGGVLPPMPLFLLPDWYVNVPLEATYQQTWQGLPALWRDALTPPVTAP